MNETHNLFIVVNKDFYFYKVEPNCICPFKTGFFWKVVRKIWDHYGWNYPGFLINDKITRKCEKVIFSDSGFGGNIRLLNRIRSIVGNKKLILYYMNNINDTNKHYMDFFDEVYTFDKKDSEMYLIRHSIFPFTDYYLNDLEQKENFKYDVVFLGRVKEREHELLKIKKQIESLDLRTCFMALDAKDPGIRIEHYVDYQKYIEIVKQSKCLIEILQQGQEGSSLRVKEALFMKKRLITNNKETSSQWFFDAPNMYILGEDKRNLKDFINGEYIEHNIDLRELNFEYWINQF